MSATYSFEFSSGIPKEIVKDKIENIVGSNYSITVFEGEKLSKKKWEGLDLICDIGYYVGDENEKNKIQKTVPYLQSIAFGRRVRYWPSLARDVDEIEEFFEPINVEDVFAKYPPSMAYNLPCYLLKS